MSCFSIAPTKTFMYMGPFQIKMAPTFNISLLCKPFSIKSLNLWTGNNDYLVELLLQHPQLNVNLRGMDGYTALIRACQERADYVAMLLSHPDIDINLVIEHLINLINKSISLGYAKISHKLQKDMMRTFVDQNIFLIYFYSKTIRQLQKWISSLN